MPRGPKKDDGKVAISIDYLSPSNGHGEEVVLTTDLRVTPLELLGLETQAGGITLRIRRTPEVFDYST